MNKKSGSVFTGNIARINLLSPLFARILALALCGAIVSGTCACSKKKKAVSAEIPNEVKTAMPVVMDAKLYGKYSAKIEAAEDVEIRARVGGYLEKANFKNGARVRKGEVLFKIDDRSYRAALAAAEANVKAAQSKISLCRDNAERARGLFKKNAISKEAYQTRETELLLAQAKLLEANAARENALLNLEYTNVVAPVSGRVSENFVDEGNLVAAHSTKLARIVDDSRVKAYFELNSADASRYKNSGLLKSIDANKGAHAALKIRGENRVYEGTLSYYDNALGRGTASLIVRADFKNDDGSLTAGSYADISVDEGIVKDALLLPEEIIGTDLTGRFVLTVDSSGSVRQTPVKLGFAVGNCRVVNSGIDKNSVVIIGGIQRAVAGAKVKTQTVEIPKPKL